MVLVINTGSSSIKYQLINMNTEETVIRGIVEHIGEESIITQKMKNGDIHSHSIYLPDHRAAFYHFLSLLEKKNEINVIGHRVAHGGTYYAEPTLITDEVIANIETLAEFAPLHNSANALGIRICQEVFGEDLPQVAVFDTAFHKDIPLHAFLYPIPYRYYMEYGVRRFGFHGISHRYVSERCAQLMGRQELKIISCHLGNGCSVAAIKNGICMDTSMGFTPNEGLMMGTRSGSVDPYVLNYIAKREGLSIEVLLELCNQESGLLGISGESNDYRELMASNCERANLAVHMQQYQILKTIGSYLAVLDGADAIIFTGGIGERVPQLREYICESLHYAGVIMDKEANVSTETEKCISTEVSKIAVFVIPTNEELMIARDTISAINDNKEKSGCCCRRNYD